MIRRCFSVFMQDIESFRSIFNRAFGYEEKVRLDKFNKRYAEIRPKIEKEYCSDLESFMENDEVDEQMMVSKKFLDMKARVLAYDFEPRVDDSKPDIDDAGYRNILFIRLWIYGTVFCMLAIGVLSALISFAHNILN